MGTAGMRASLAEPRGDRRLDRARLRRAHVRRGDRDLRLRQDDPRHGDGAVPAQRPERDAVRRLDHAGPLPRRAGDDPGGVRGGRQARRRDRSPTRSSPSSRRSRRPAPARAAGSSPPTRWRWRSRCSGSRRPASRWSRRPIPDKAEVAAERRQARDRRARARTAAQRDHHPGGARERDRGDRLAAAGSTNGVLHLLAVASEVGRRAHDRRLRPDQRAHAAAVRPEARRAVRRRRTFTRPAACRSCCKRLNEAGLLHATQQTVTGRTDRRDRRRCAGDRGAAGRPPAQRPDQADRRLAILRGNLAPEGCVVKLAGHERRRQSGPGARVRVRGGRDGGGQRAAASSPATWS